MDRVGLSPGDFAAYRRVFTRDHQRQIRLDVLDLADGSHLRSLTPKVLDGQVDGDVTARTTRSADIRFYTTGSNLGFDPNDPSDAPVHRSRVIRVWDCRYVAELGDWVDAAVITGPVVDFDRTGPEVSVTVHGMEEQAYGQLWPHTYHAKAKSKVTDAIRDLLALAGDTNAQVPDLPHTLPHPLDLHPMETIWPHVKKLAASLDRVAMYDGHGRFNLRPHSGRGVYRFHATLMTSPRVQRGGDTVPPNVIVVLGPKPHGPHKKRIQRHAIIAGPLSPTGLQRHSVPLHLVEEHQHDHLKTGALAQKIANRIARERGVTRTDLSWEAVPVPFLEEHDRVVVVDDAFGSTHARLRQWTLPLGGSDTGGTTGPNMTIGTNRRVTKVRLR